MISAALLQDKAFSPIKWIVPDLLPEGLTVLAGKPKLGKSWLVLDLAVAVAQGGWTLGDRHCQAGSVLYGALEDSERRLKSRMEKVCHKAAWPAGLHFATEISALTNGGLDEIEGWIDANPDARLVIVDTFAKVRPGKTRDETQYEADYRAAGMLKRLADSRRVAVIMVHHTTKAPAEDPFDMISGTNGLAGAVDTLMVITTGAAGVTLHTRGRDVELAELAIQFDRESCRWRVLGDAGEVHRNDERKAIVDALGASSEPMTIKEVADITGHPSAATRKLLFRMAAVGHVVRTKRGVYALPENARSYV
jgi:hypothetical protein